MAERAETQALFAILAEDHETAERIVADMLPYEQRILEDAADALSNICYDQRRARGEGNRLW